MINIEHIVEKAQALAKRYGTRDPFLLCSELGINVRLKELGTKIKAYFFCQSRIKTIVINQRTTENIRKVLCAHELGHAVLHQKLAAMHGFHELELFDCVNTAEYEANLFAAELLIDDEELLKLLNDSEKSFFDVAGELYVPVELLDFKFRALKKRGYHIEAPYISPAEFLKDDLPECFDS